MFFIIGMLSLVFLGGISTGPGKGNVAVIDITGAITTQDASGFGAVQASSSRIVNFIETADSDNRVSAILFRINSGGGSPVATEEIASAIQNTNKTTVAVIRDTGASGAYWVASATDTIFASRMSIVGSIGVTGSNFGIDELLEEYNVTYRRLVTGEYKDIGSPFKEMTDEERLLFQERLEVLHRIFAETIADNRNLTDEEISKIANGLFWTGMQAKDIGLIDEFGGEREALKYIEEKLGIKAEAVEYRRDPSLGDLFFGVFNEMSYQIGKGFGASLSQDRPAHESILI